MKVRPLTIKPCAEHGFSVLEAIIAMAVLSIAFLPLLQMQSQFVKSVDSFQRAELRNSARLEAANYLATKNLTLMPAGVQTLGVVELTWQSSPRGEARKAKDMSGLATRYDIIMYETKVTLNHITTNRQIDEYYIQTIGWKPNRAFIDDLF